MRVLLMLTIDGRPAHCLVCGSTELTDTGYDHLFRFVAMSRFSCVCGARLELHDIVTLQADAIEKARKAPKARTADREPSQAAAQLDFTGRRQQVYEALVALGSADTTQIADWVNAQGYKRTERNSVARRLNDLEADGVATRSGEHLNADGHLCAVWRLTETARRQAA